ncbi:hypothetical protein ACIPLC_26890 [Kitasatospora sp. NPDC086801]|uniref:hypothetical protein n=1 Tax=Kitasatospora sp. NPDC086801 TaxID=3364066 RepID=UPI00380ABC30
MAGEQVLQSNGVWGSSAYGDRVNKILTEAGIGLEMVDGGFEENDEGAEELEVQDATTRPLSLFTGKYATAHANWAKALVAQKTGDERQAVALAVNTLEGVVKIASGKKSTTRGCATCSRKASVLRCARRSTTSTPTAPRCRGCATAAARRIWSCTGSRPSAWYGPPSCGSSCWSTWTQGRPPPGHRAEQPEGGPSPAHYRSGTVNLARQRQRQGGRASRSR